MQLIQTSSTGPLPGGLVGLWVWASSWDGLPCVEDRAHHQAVSFGWGVDPRITRVVSTRLAAALERVPITTPTVIEYVTYGGAYWLVDAPPLVAQPFAGMNWLRSYQPDSSEDQSTTHSLGVGGLCDVVMLSEALGDALLRRLPRSGLRLGPVWRAKDQRLGICLARGSVAELAARPWPRDVQLLRAGEQVEVPGVWPQRAASGVRWLRPPDGNPPYLPGPGVLAHLISLALPCGASMAIPVAVTDAVVPARAAGDVAGRALRRKAGPR